MDPNKKYNHTIYCISVVNDDKPIEYVGSTYQKLSRRMSEHRSKLYNENNEGYNLTLYKYIRENHPEFYFGMEDVIILEVGYLTVAQARAVEQSYINELKPMLNKYAASSGLTHEQYQAQYLATKYQCQCGSVTSLHHKSAHEKTKKHLTYITNTLNQYYKTSEDKHETNFKNNTKFK